LFWYVDSKAGFGLSTDYAEQIAEAYYGEKTERDGLIDKMRRASIDVNTDWQEGERVLNNVNLKANSERNGAFSGDSSTNSKSFEGKVHLHRSSLSDSKDVAKVQQNFETAKDLAKKNCLLSYHSALIAGASARQLQKIGELFISRYRKLFLPQTCPDIQMYPEP